MKILCVHGIGHIESDLNWLDSWIEKISGAFQEAQAPDPEIQSVAYDDLFDFPLDAATIGRALVLLTRNGVNSGLTDLGNELSNLFGRRRGLVEDLSSQVGWTAGMVVQWAGDPALRKAARERVLDRVADFKPDVVCAHSLGSLISFDAFVQPPGNAALAGKVFISLGSQIGNDFVKGTFGGRLDLPAAKAWYHLFNKHDWMFTAAISDPADNFEQVEADFSDPPLNHAAVQYLANPDVAAQVWDLLAQPAQARAVTMATRAFDQARATTRRALLVGINDYPNPNNRLEGCVNDVFLMSAVLQESGFAADDIRVVLDERATAQGILERLHWLLDDVRPNDQRLFYYSGHGAQLPGYGFEGKPDRLHATLVPYDFNWAGETAITDDKFDDFYSELPYEARFVAVFDCCYSGGMARDGGARVRGIDPPDDIRHRMLKWDAEHEMWVPRTFEPDNRDLAARKYHGAYVGSSGSRLLGRAVGLRTLPDRQFAKVCKDLKHKGPYLPVVYEACQENQYSYEYRHGVTSYGAFTYSLSRVLRHYRTLGRALTFAKLFQEVKQTLADLKYDQVPTLLGPDDFLKKSIPWGPASRTGGARGG